MIEVEEEIERIVQVLNRNRKLRKEAGMSCGELFTSSRETRVEDYVANLVKALVTKAIVGTDREGNPSAQGGTWDAFMPAEAGKPRKVPKKRGRPRIEKNQLTLAISPKDHSLVLEVPED